MDSDFVCDSQYLLLRPRKMGAIASFCDAILFGGVSYRCPSGYSVLL